MNSGTVIASEMLSGNSFSDEYVIKFEDSELVDAQTTVTEEPQDRIVLQKNTVTVPILEAIPHLTVWSPQYSISTLSTTSSPTQDSLITPIQWNNADLMYLLSCLLPDLLLHSQLTFDPTLVNLPTTPSPIHLRLYKKIPIAPVPPEAYSKDAPIGTGRPQSRMLITESHPKCENPEAARISLATNILANEGFVAYMLDKYNVLTTLYASSTDTLLSLRRGMIEMLGVSEAEWVERFEQLGGKVDGGCTLEARLEVFWLGVGIREVEEWADVVDTAVEMEEGDRRAWGEVYGDAARFLGRCVEERYS